MALLQSVKMLLEERQIPSETAFPTRRMPRLLKPTVMLRFQKRSVNPFCFQNLLGEKNFEPQFVYELSEEVCCEIYSPYLSGGYACEDLADSVFFNVSSMLSGAMQCSVSRTPVFYDPDTDCFRASVDIVAVNWVQAPNL